MKFDSTLNLGHMLTILALFASASGLYANTMIRFTEYDLRIKRVEAMHTQIVQNSATLIAIREDLAVIRFQLQGVRSKKEEPK